MERYSTDSGWPPNMAQPMGGGPLTRLLGFLLCGLVGVTGCSRKSQPDTPRRGANPAVPVTVTNTIAQDVPVVLSGIGTVRPYSTVTVKSQIKGILARVEFKEGDEVQAGSPIFLVDPQPYQAALNMSLANVNRDKALLVKADADYRRARDLLQAGIMSQSDFDQSLASMDSLKATVVADEAAVTNAQVQLSYCSIRSPITGRVGTLLVNQGNIVKDLDTVLVVINQLKPIYVDFSVPSRSANPCTMSNSRCS